MGINVGLVSHGPNLHGSERSLVNLALLYQTDPKITAVLMIPPNAAGVTGEMSIYADKANIRSVKIPPNNWYIYKSPTRPSEFKKYCEHLRIELAEYIRIFQQNSIDMVISNTLTNFIPALAAYLLQLKTIIWVHGYLDHRIIHQIDPDYQAAIDYNLLRLNDHLIYCSEWTKLKFLNLIPNYNFSDSIIKNWTHEPTSILDYHKTKKHFLCLNTMDKLKGIDLIINAAKIIKDKGYDCKVDLHGIGLEIQNMIDLIYANGLEDQVKIFPRNVFIEDLYNSNFVLLQPSYYESFGRTIIEAMSHKRPVIAATTADPTKSIRDGKNGFLFEPGNVSQLAEKMLYFLENPDHGRGMGEAGYEIYQKEYSPAIAKTSFDQVIHDLYLQSSDSRQIKTAAFNLLNSMHHNVFSDV